MPPKKTEAQRRGRNASPQEDLHEVALRILTSNNITDTAASQDDSTLPILKEALKAGVSPDMQVSVMPILHLFASEGMLKCVEELLRYGADPSIPIRDGSNSDALMVAVKPTVPTSIAVKIVSRLLKNPKVNQLQSVAASLVAAIAAGATEIAETLFAEGPSHLPSIMFDGAMRSRHETMAIIAVKYLKPSPSKITDLAENHMHAAASFQSSDILKLFLDNEGEMFLYEKKLECEAETVFLTAVKAGSLNNVKLLLDEAIEYDDKDRAGKGAIQIAIEYNRHEILKLLLADGNFESDLTADIYTIALKNYVECFKAFTAKREIPSRFIRLLVSLNRVEMLNFMFSSEVKKITDLKLEFLETLVKETKDKDIKQALQTKITAMKKTVK